MRIPLLYSAAPKTVKVGPRCPLFNVGQWKVIFENVVDSVVHLNGKEVKDGDILSAGYYSATIMKPGTEPFITVHAELVR